MFIQGLILDNPSLATIFPKQDLCLCICCNRLVTGPGLGMTDKLILGKHKSGLAPADWFVPGVLM